MKVSQFAANEDKPVSGTNIVRSWWFVQILKLHPYKYWLNIYNTINSNDSPVESNVFLLE